MASDIDWLREHVEAQRVEFHVPGVAVGAVIDGEIVLSEGFGQRDIENDLPVTSNTLFAFGSSTKSLTGLLVAMYVDDGLLDWDTPVRDYIAGFRMADPVATEQLTVRDLLCHNSGMPRHEFAWITNQNQSRAQLVKRLAHLPSSKPFRRAWNYNNLMYITAGHLVELVSGKSWEDALRERVLDPLGMSGANFHITESQRAADYARGYKRDNDDTVELPMRAMGVAGPAGSLNVTLDDALRWLQFNLDPKQTLVPEAVLQNVHNNHMHMPKAGLIGFRPEWDETFAVGYGLGWFIDSYRGLRVVHHGGNVDGFTAMTSMVPSRRSGMVILTNLNGALLTHFLPYRLYDHILGLDPIAWGERINSLLAARSARKEEADDGASPEPESEPDADDADAGAGAKEEAPPHDEGQPARALDDYVGTYEHAGYGKITVRLAANAADQTLECSLNDVDLALARKRFDAFTATAITPMPPGAGTFTVIFNPDASGDIGSLGMTLEATMPPIAFARASDKIAPEVLRTLPGKYVSAIATLTITLKGDKLFAELPGQGELELAPRRGLTFEVAAAPGQTLEFVLSDDGTHAVKIVHPAATFEREDEAERDGELDPTAV